MKKIDLTGQKYFRLLVIEQDKDKNKTNKHKRVYWKCKCDCGKFTVVESSKLKDGHTKSCGCLLIDVDREKAYKLYSVNIKYTPREATARRVWGCRYNDELSFEDFYRLSQLLCFYCGAKPNNKQNSAIYDKKASEYAKENGDFIYNGVDRLNSDETHILENCVPCCKWCNFSKRERSVEDFKEWAINLYKHQFENKKD